MKSLRRTLADYLCLRRSLGFKMLNESAALPAFVSFVHRRKSPYITTRLALDWAQQGREGQSKWRFSMVRGLAKHTAIFDARTEVPELGLLRTKYPRPRPYIYSDQEIEQHLHAFHSRIDPLQHALPPRKERRYRHRAEERLKVQTRAFGFALVPLTH